MGGDGEFIIAAVRSHNQFPAGGVAEGVIGRRLCNKGKFPVQVIELLHLLSGKNLPDKSHFS